jgi:UDP-N-acetylmuramate dehydrogenase
MSSWRTVSWPALRGKLTAGAELAGLTWLRAGGPADWLFEPADLADLQTFLACCPAAMPITVLGAGSNVLVRDGGLDGAVIRLSGELADIRHEGDVVTAGAGARDMDVARYAAEAGLDGLAFLIGIPGTIGGGLRMNAGAYGREFCDIVISASALTRQGELIEASVPEMQMSYRRSGVPEDWIFVSARLQARPGDRAEIRARMKEMIASRGASQPVGARTGGSTFANPEGGKAWQVIEAAGCRGLRIGGALMSEKHCNFMINDGSATAADLEQLGETVRQKVRDQCGTELRWEIRRLGRTPAQASRQEPETG